MEPVKKNVNRIDGVDPGKWMTTPFKETDEGFFQGKAIVTSVGVFSYKNVDGTITRELRLPEEVFSYATMESMKGKPVVNDHPKERVTPDNSGIYQVGNIGTDPSSYIDGYMTSPGSPNSEGVRGSPYSDGYHVAVTLTITDADAIADVKAGKTALSMGYTCDIEAAPEGAVWCGMAYDCIQRNIRYNHVAIVDKARAGDAARIRMDGEAIQINDTGSSPKSNQEENSMLRKIRIDGVEYEGDDGLIGVYQTSKRRADDAEAVVEKLQKDLDKLKEELSKMEADRDNNKDRADKLDTENKGLKEQSIDPKRLDEAVKTRVELLDAAIRAGVEVKDGVSDSDIQKAIITKIYPEAKLDGRDEAYIKGRFDSAIEELRKDADDLGRPVVSDSIPAAGDREDSTSAYRRMIEFNKKRSRGDSKE